MRRCRSQSTKSASDNSLEATLRSTSTASAGWVVPVLRLQMREMRRALRTRCPGCCHTTWSSLRRACAAYGVEPPGTLGRTPTGSESPSEGALVWRVCWRGTPRWSRSPCIHPRSWSVCRDAGGHCWSATSRTPPWLRWVDFRPCPR